MNNDILKSAEMQGFGSDILQPKKGPLFFLAKKIPFLEAILPIVASCDVHVVVYPCYHEALVSNY